MNLKLLGISVFAGLTFAVGAHATVLTFEDLAEGTTLSNQYAALGVIFSPNGFSGADGPTGNWATNTDMTITSTDIGGLGTPAGLVSGNLLHSFGNTTANGWLSEDGDPSFKMSFSRVATGFSAAFAGVATPGDVKLFVYNGTTLLSTVSGTVTTGEFILSYAGAFTSIIVTPGSFDDWVGVDNITYTLAPVPEPGTYALMAIGLAGVGLMARRRRIG